jgi:peptide methionine sulfoxide reductase MsrA
LARLTVDFWCDSVKRHNRHKGVDFMANPAASADYQQQYLAKNPNGYCGIGGCGVPFKLAELQVAEKA